MMAGPISTDDPASVPGNATVQRSHASDRPRLLISTVGVGAGHNTAARAIAQEVQERWSEAEVRVVDLLDLMPRACRATMLLGHVQGMTRLSWIYGLSYRSSDRRKGGRLSPGERLRHFLCAPILRRLQKMSDEFRPDFVVHTHWLGLSALAARCAAEQVRGRQLVVVTDLCAHRFWYAPNVDHWFVATPETVNKFLGYDVPESALTVSGIPVRPEWDRPVDAAQVRQDWSFPPERPMLLVSGGATFTVGGIPGLSQRLATACPDALVVVLCGTNRKLQDSIERLARIYPNVRAIPFTPRVHELVAASTLFVTKSGGLTSTECLAAGAASVLLPPVPGQEAENAEWLVSQGAAVVGSSFEDVVHRARRLLDDPAARSALSQSAHALHRPSRQTIVRYLQDHGNTFGSHRM